MVLMALRAMTAHILSQICAVVFTSPLTSRLCSQLQELQELPTSPLRMWSSSKKHQLILTLAPGPGVEPGSRGHKADALPLSYPHILTLKYCCGKRLRGTALKNCIGNCVIHKKIDKRYWELQPFLDPEGVIRINSRLTPHLEVTPEAAQPMLLHRSMEMAQLLAWEIHSVKLRHCGGSRTLLDQLRREHWVIGGAFLAKETSSNCHFCARLKAQPYRLPLPPLHPSRTGLFTKGRLQAFSEIGIDFCGPYFATVGRSQVKRHVLVIACCITRAVNIEVCHSLDGKSCLAALEHHMARYGRPSYVNSDNGSNFLALARHLEERLRILRQGGVPESARRDCNIEWYFNPPASPTWSGHVEIFVKMVKRALRCLKPRIKTAFSDEELTTLMVQTQGFINMRPLLDIMPDRLPLTSADFLLTGNPRLSGLLVVAPERMGLDSRKELIQGNLEEVWERFKTDYVLSLRKNVKLLPKGRQIAERDAVVILDNEGTKIPGKWKCGVVVKAHEGKDEHQRSFDILVDGNKIFKRNYRALGRLPRPSVVPDGYRQVDENGST